MGGGGTPQRRTWMSSSKSSMSATVRPLRKVGLLVHLHGQVGRPRADVHLASRSMGLAPSVPDADLGPAREPRGQSQSQGHVLLPDWDQEKQPLWVAVRKALRGHQAEKQESWKGQALKEAETGARWGLKNNGWATRGSREDSPCERYKASVLCMGTGIRG